jgi:hypothetical protein
MGDEVTIIKDDDYNELEGVFSKDSEIPGDEVTGIINPKGADDSKGDDNDDSDSDDDDSSSDSDSDSDSSDDSDADDDGAADDSAEEDSKKGDDDSKSDADDADDKGADKDDKDEDDSSGDKDAEEEKEDKEADLRTQLRDQQRRVALTEAKLDTYSRQRKADKDAAASDDEDEEASDVEPSTIEAAQLKLNEIAETRGEIVADMLELMKVNPKYEDVESVCSKNNLDDTIETLARAQVAKDGGDLVEIMMGLEVDIWSQRNPYSYMYGLIKDIHPRYVKDEDKDTGDDDKGDTSKDKKGKKTPKKAPLSAIDLARGGGDKNAGEWTAEKIDNLDEAELDKVPKDVYAKYMRGDLDK